VTGPYRVLRKLKDGEAIKPEKVKKGSGGKDKDTKDQGGKDEDKANS